MKKCLSVFLTVIIIVIMCASPVSSLADKNDETDYIFTYHDVDYEVDRPETQDGVQADFVSGAKAATEAPAYATTIPSSYSSVTNKKVTSAKHQGSYGTNAEK